MNEEKTYQEEYNDFWKDIVEKEDGTLNKDQVMRELSDYTMIMDNCSKAYSLMTKGRISKQNTHFFEVENIFYEKYIDMEDYEELEQQLQAYKDKEDELRELKEQISDLETALRLQIKNVDLLEKENDKYEETIGLYQSALICATEKAEESLDKLEKIREYVEHNDFSDWHIGKDKDQFRKNDILQILNEGKRDEIK